MIKFTANKEAAVQAFHSTRIEETGDYIGTFKIAKAVTSAKGTEGVEFEFEAKDGRNARYLTLWTQNAEGKEIYGAKQLSALMTVMGVESIEAVDTMVKEYDFDEKANVSVERGVFPQLMGVPVGVVLRVEEYEKSNGEIGEKMAFVNFFSADSRKTAAEVIHGDQAHEIDGLMKVVRDKRLGPHVKDVPKPSKDFDDALNF